MVYYKKYEPIKKIICGKKEKFDNNIFSFDIETTSILMLNGKVLTNNEYEKLNDKEKEKVDKKSLMYIWMFSVNEVVYFGPMGCRTGFYLLLAGDYESKEHHQSCQAFHGTQI